MYFHSAPLPTSLFLSHNEALVPPYRIIVDTNFINLSLENRMDMVKSMMDALYAKCKSSGSAGGCGKGKGKENGKGERMLAAQTAQLELLTDQLIQPLSVACGDSEGVAKRCQGVPSWKPMLEPLQTPPHAAF